LRAARQKESYFGRCTRRSDYPKEASTALTQPGQTRLARESAALLRAHEGKSGFHLLAQGIDSFLVRLELAARAQRTLDLEYFIFQDDETGRLLVASLLDAADRGVRVRVLVDDAEDVTKNPELVQLSVHPGIEVRVFNPFNLRGPLTVLRYAEFLLTATRVNYRMHNKVFVADNSVAVVGGRNVGDEYFEASPDVGFADFDVAALGPVVARISGTFDAYWNSDVAIPMKALMAGPINPEASARDAPAAPIREAAADTRFAGQLAAGNPLDGLLSNPEAFAYADAEVLYDTPDKRKAESGGEEGPLMRRRLISAIEGANSELLITSPYVVPGDGGMKLIESVRARGVGVRIITNSLASTEMPIAHVGYRHYRKRLLEDGVDLCELRPTLEVPEVHAESDPPRKFALHGKVFVFDRKRVFIGSMNFDRRSLRVNTEMGLLINSPELARQVAEHFDALARPANCYVPVLAPPDASGQRALSWRTEENGRSVTLDQEPHGDLLRGLKTDVLSLLPIDDLL